MKMEKKTYIFQTSKGFSLDGKGATLRKAVCNAKKDLDKFNKSKFGDGGELTGRYNTYDRNDLVQTGYFPKKFEYKGKPLTEKEADDFLKRIYLKPTAIYDLSERTGKYKKRKIKWR